MLLTGYPSILAQFTFRSTHYPNFILPAIVDRHIASFPRIIAVGSELAHKIFQSKSTLHEDTCLAILACNHIVGTQCCRGADSDTFFAGRNLDIKSIQENPESESSTNHIEAQTPMSLRFEHKCVHDVHCCLMEIRKHEHPRK